MGVAKIDSLISEINKSKIVNRVNYKDFTIDYLFDIKSPKKKFNAIDVSFNGIYPYVVRSNTNNGIKGYIDEDIQYLNEGNTISFGQDTATMFYQEQPYFTGDKIKIFSLKPTILNKSIALFLITVMQESFKYFSWGKTKFDEKTLKKVTISLPVNSKCEPDWDYMQKWLNTIYIYISSPNLGKLKKLQKEVEQEKIIDISGWGNFKLKDIFNYNRGKRYKKGDHIKGELPYVSSSAENNGIDNYVSIINGLHSYKNCITVANSGSVGKCFYHEYEFVPSDHVHVLWLKDIELTKAVAMFLIAVLEQNKHKFNFNKEISNITINEINLRLPITKNGKPDYLFMTKFIKDIFEF